VKRSHMTPVAMMQFQQRHALTNRDLGMLLGYTKQHVDHFRAGTTPIPKPVALLLELIDSDPDLVREVIAHERKNEHALEVQP
jgi:hypothetical protein